MRLGALTTGGCNLFLTNGSGSGGLHLEPTVPRYFVTRLQKAMIRMIRTELEGQHREPAPSDVLRTGGDPHDRHCALESGQEVLAF
jgi:hypothetical protein